jgi:hypothetical protein
MRTEGVKVGDGAAEAATPTTSAAMSANTKSLTLDRIEVMLSGRLEGFKP